MPNPLKTLNEYGQSVWLDFVSRELLKTGQLTQLIADDGLRGVTSNPSIFEKAIGHGDDYDELIAAAQQNGDLDPGALFEELAVRDIQEGADALRPVYHQTQGRDGFISLEVSPYLALQTHETIEEARRLWREVGRENLMVKVPGTKAGLPAIRTLIGEGINVNVTLLFSQEVYAEVAEAYISGLEALARKGGDPHKVASVASFFVSRIDTLVDEALDKRIAATSDPAEKARLEALKGKVAIANAKLAYQRYARSIRDERWQRLAQQGAQSQRLLWASTGTKNKAYSDVLYVDELIGADTVNTMPPATMDAFRDHGRPRAEPRRGRRRRQGGDGALARGRDFDRGGDREAGRGRGAPVRRRRRPALRRGPEKAPHGARPQARPDELQAAGTARQGGQGGDRGLAPRGEGPAAVGRRRLVVDRGRRGQMDRLARHRRPAAEGGRPAARISPPMSGRPASRMCCCSAWAGRASAPRCLPRPSRRSPAIRRCMCSIRPTRRRSVMSRA